MAPALDHLLLAVRDLERTAREFRAAGIDVVAGSTPGLPHSGVPTAGARIPCRNGVAIDLLSYGVSPYGQAVRLLAKTPAWGPLRSRGSAVERYIGDGLATTEGLIGMSILVDDLAATVRALRDEGFDVDDPVDFTRTDATGAESGWRVASPNDPTLPVLVERILVEPIRVEQLIPSAAAQESGIDIDWIAVRTDDTDRTATGYRVVLGEPDADGSWQLGPVAIRLDGGGRSPGLPKLRACLGATPLPRSGSSLGLVDAFNTVDTHSAASIDRLAQALRLQTVSYEDPTRIDDSQFVQLGELLETSFPKAHSELIVEKFGHSRLYTWPGTDPTRVAGLFLAHLDVVPVDDPDRWTHPPFSGVVDDEFVWGRGAIDDKSRVLALLEAIEGALADGVRPNGTLYFAFGHDEEIGGQNGACVIARELLERGVRAEILLDEGGVVTRGVVDGIDRPVASIMLGEKGFATVRLSTRDLGGHSSMPPKHTAVGRISRAVVALEDNPMPLLMSPTVLDMTKRLAPFMSEPRRSLLRSAERFSGVIARILTARPQTEALVRTTTAATVIRGGVKANVLPQHAEALVNFRILPGESVADVLAHCRATIADDRVDIELAPGMLAEPSPVSPSDGPEFALVAESARKVLPDVAVTTGLVPGATDARHYNDVAAVRFNFAPIILEQADLERIHGSDERISHENYQRLIAFDRILLERL